MFVHNLFHVVVAMRINKNNTCIITYINHIEYCKF